MLVRSIRGSIRAVVAAATVVVWTAPAQGQHMGACCLPDEQCIMVDEEQCIAEGGEYHGDGTMCMDADCHDHGPGGACCLSDDLCMMLDEEQCIAEGGEYQGDGTMCMDAGCHDHGPGGACCLSDDLCMMLDEEQCIAEGGEYQGDETDCMHAPCHGEHHCDFDGDGCVGVHDLVMMMLSWGSCPEPPAACPADVDSSGATDVGDLLILVMHWGCG